MFYEVSHRLRLFADFGPECPETDICFLTTVEFDENWRIAVGLLADLTNYFRVCDYIYIYMIIYVYIYISPSF